MKNCDSTDQKIAKGSSVSSSWFSSITCRLRNLALFNSPSACEEGPCIRCLLTDAPRKQTFRIVGVTGENCGKKRLADLGLVETALVSVSSSSRFGLILRLTSGSRLAIDRTLAQAVTVESL